MASQDLLACSSQRTQRLRLDHKTAQLGHQQNVFRTDHKLFLVSGSIRRSGYLFSEVTNQAHIGSNGRHYTIESPLSGSQSVQTDPPNGSSY